MAFPFDHPLRSKVDNNWFITPAKIGKFFTPEQQAHDRRKSFAACTIPNSWTRFLAHMKEGRGRIRQLQHCVCSANPAPGAFEFVLAGPPLHSALRR